MASYRPQFAELLEKRLVLSSLSLVADLNQDTHSSESSAVVQVAEQLMDRLVTLKKRRFALIRSKSAHSQLLWCTGMEIIALI